MQPPAVATINYRSSSFFVSSALLITAMILSRVSGRVVTPATARRAVSAFHCSASPKKNSFLNVFGTRGIDGYNVLESSYYRSAPSPAISAAGNTQQALNGCPFFKRGQTQLFSSRSKEIEEEEEYDWDVLLPFQKHSHNSIKIIVPDPDLGETESTSASSDFNDPYHISTFHSKLEATLATAKQLHKSALWLTVPISRASLIEEASKLNFQFHHAEGNTATLNQWLLENEPSRIPTYATHQVGVGAVVINSNTNQILCVREKRNNYRPWKIPGGLAELGEDLDEAVVREVMEETGIPTKFLSVMAVRHTHGMQFGRSDLYFVCRLEPVVDEKTGEVPKPVAQEGEIEAVSWVDLDEYRGMVNHPESGRGHPMMSQIMKIVDQKNWEERDIQRTIVSSVVPGRRPSPVYHAAVRSDE